MILVKPIKYTKYISFILITAMIACSAPVRSVNQKTIPTLTHQEAEKALMGYYKTRLFNEYGLVYEGNLKGWNDIGFIGELNGKIDTVQYEMLFDVLALETDEALTEKGALIGGGIGAVLSLIYIALIYAGSDKDSDFGELREEITTSVSLIVTGGSAAIGAVYGSNKRKYKKYYYDKDQFINNPYYYSESVHQ